jgi:hypothetical protein
MGLIINEYYLPIGHPNRPGIKLKGLKSRVWHGTANFRSGATDTMNVGYASREYTKKWNEDKKKWDYFEVNGDPFSFGSAHVYIDVDSATLSIPLDEVAYSCGDRQLPYQNIQPGIRGYKGQTKLAYDIFNNQNNSWTWSIELCMNQMDKWDLVCDNAIEFVKEYMPGLELLDLRHWDLTAKVCPSPFVDLTIKEIDPRWLTFKEKVRKVLGE